MCGIVGVAGTLGKQDKDAFTNLLYLAALRGMDSTGMARITRANAKGEWMRPDIVKKAWASPDFITWRGYHNAAQTTNTAAFLGHTRFSTVGSSIVGNAHPFEFDTLVGMHNGTLQNKHVLTDDNKFGTDSEAALSQIDTDGPDVVIPLLRGAWCFVWYDYGLNAIMMIRNAERPLYWTYDKDRQSLFWASEIPMLQFALSRAGINYNKIFGAKEDTLYTHVIPEHDQPFGKAKAKTLAGAKPLLPAYQGEMYGFGGAVTAYQRGERWNAKTRSWQKDGDVVSLHPDKSEAAATGTAAAVGTNIADSIAHYKGFEGNVLTKEEFEKATDVGCAWCVQDVDWGDVVRFISKDAFLCPNCMHDPDVLQYIDEGIGGN